ncbi:TPA: gp53-like domain-containing protein [Citrobacter amalonaticus]
MHRIDTATAQKDKFGAGKNGFTRGNPQTGTPATDLDDDYFDMIQEELCRVVEESGEELDKGKHDQLLTALRALLLSRSNPFGDIASDGPEAIATALVNLGLGTAATKDVGTGENQIPDMSSFGSGSGWSQLPNGKLLQWGTYTGSAITGTINFPVPFPNSVGRVIMSLSGTSADAGSIAYVVQDDNSLSKTSFFFRRAGAQVRFNWFCIGE